MSHLLMNNIEIGEASEIDNMIKSLEEELKTAVLVGVPCDVISISDDESSEVSQEDTLPVRLDDESTIPSVDFTPECHERNEPFVPRTCTLRRWPSHRSCGSSSCSTLGTSSTTTSSSRRRREPTVVDFIKATGQDLDNMSVSEMKRYMNRKFIRLANEWENEVKCHKPQEEEELLEVSQRNLVDDENFHNNVDDDDKDDFFDALDMSYDTFETCLNEEEEEDLLFKASLNPNCGLLEVEGIMLLSELEAESC